jgi:peptidoglycan/LPS O-acetylase OafA/YrhL
MLGDVFDRRANGLNALRLLLATSVIVWHSFPLTGRTVDWGPARQLLAEGGVDGFFAISGFLITMSWARHPEAPTYCRARFLRIMPAYWVCLVVTAFVLVPVGIALAGQGSASLGDRFGYVVHNAALWMGDFRVGASPEGVPYTDAWNGSLWTLFWEAVCYVGVLAVGALGLLRRPKRTVVVLFVTMFAMHCATVYGPVDHFAAVAMGRFGLLFAAGALVWAFADALPVRPALVAGAGAVVLVASFLPEYRTVAALPLAYALVGAGALLKARIWHPANDVSYGMYIYAFPSQQLLASAGLAAAPVALFMVASALLTLPMAALSWFGIERPALRLKRPRRTETPVYAYAGG